MTIEEKAKNIYPDMAPPDGYNGIARIGFIEGAEWMFENAIEWLSNNAKNYYKDASMHDNCWYDDEQMVEDFKKSMEE